MARWRSTPCHFSAHSVRKAIYDSFMQAQIESQGPPPSLISSVNHPPQILHHDHTVDASDGVDLSPGCLKVALDIRTFLSTQLQFPSVYRTDSRFGMEW
ncbi:hypothetical protein AVEN_244903-1 [Araneus ventricosus]|uniref:Uncharacterized protein n=1 Tax=Araneus ventricosus TaxID=182803 RepID=A0A4Y2DXZ3_ARAVE|nr:hypothetical protein AVEN_244903-1 [Araneus ventricosus]